MKKKKKNSKRHRRFLPVFRNAGRGFRLPTTFHFWKRVSSARIIIISVLYNVYFTRSTHQTYKNPFFCCSRKTSKTRYVDSRRNLKSFSHSFKNECWQLTYAHNMFSPIPWPLYFSVTNKICAPKRTLNTKFVLDALYFCLLKTLKKKWRLEWSSVGREKKLKKYEWKQHFWVYLDYEFKCSADYKIVFSILEIFYWNSIKKHLRI